MARFPSVKLATAYFGAILSIVTVVQLVKFVSYLPATATPSTSDIPEEKSGTAWVAFHNVSLTFLFFFLHSALADSSVKNFFERNGFQDLQRSVYVIMSCLALQILFYSWQPIPWFVLWNLNISSNHWMWWMYTILHAYIWVLVYIENLMLDVPELLGIKQVYYSGKELDSPELYKSSSLQRLRRHLNHTSFLGFSILFWVYPRMRLDRAVLAMLFQVYMIVNWNPDKHNLKYMREVFENKKHDLKTHTGY